MTELQKVFRLWLGLTTLFLVLATALVSGILFYRMNWLENELRHFHRTQLEARFREDHYNRISEELFLGLDNLAAREGALSSLLGGHGSVSLELTRPLPGETRPAGGSVAFDGIRWEPDGGGGERFSVPVFFSDVYLGNLSVMLGWRQSSVYRHVLLTLGVLLILLFVDWVVIVVGIQRRVFTPLLDRMMKMNYSSAVAQTTQMLAHDIRAPFSTMWTGLRLLKDAKNASEMQTVLFKLLPQVEKQMRVVDGLITDILEIGTTKDLTHTSVSADSLIESVLSDIFRIHKDADIAIEYSPAHKHLLCVDGLAVMRVFSNILENAVQAEGAKGRIWIRTEETDGKVQFCIGNGGSYIAPEDLSKLFDPFFTKGKRRGTGLGLAIAQKVVNQHGGKIWCRSTKGIGTEFFFTLPFDESAPQSEHGTLPGNSKLFAVAWKTVDPVGEASIETELLRFLSLRDKPLKVLAVDDESLYLDGVRALLRQDLQLQNRVLFFDARTCDRAYDLAVSEKPDLVICDIDMGPGCVDGVTFVERLRKQGFSSYICVHSNRRFDEDHDRAMRAGADAFYPKPISHAHLTQLLLASAKRSAEGSGPVPLVAILDDNEFVLEAWRARMSDARVRTFTGPREFWKAAEDDPKLLSELECVVSDLYFEEGEPEDGLQFLERLRQGYRVAGVLSTDAPPDGLGEAGASVVRVGKQPITWAELKGSLERISRRDVEAT